MNTVYLICFILGLVLSLLAAFGGAGHWHIGHLHVSHGHVPTHGHASGHNGAMSVINGFTLPAFLCWFGGAGYLMRHYSPMIASVVVLLAAVVGCIGAGIIYLLLFRFLLPHERVLTAEDTRMDGVVGRVSDDIRADGGIGEILFSQTGALRGSAARSETGAPIPRGTEVIVLRYERGVAYVSPLEELTR